MKQPMMYMIAGPNGAGKTTAAMELLPNFLAVHEFVNADEIARGLNPLNPPGQEVAAGRLMLKRVDDLIAAQKNFAFETTGSSHVFIEKLKGARNAGYRLGLIYLWVPHVSFSKFRVKVRVAQGGHDIAENVIERRYRRSLYNIMYHYWDLVDQASIFSNAVPSTGLQLIAERCDDRTEIHRPDVWKRMEQLAKDFAHDIAE